MIFLKFFQEAIIDGNIIEVTEVTPSEFINDGTIFKRLVYKYEEIYIYVTINPWWIKK